MQCRFEFRPYRRQFKQALQTRYGSWNVREGIILRLSDGVGRVSFGEIAPLKEFGSESLGQALDFCSQLPIEIAIDTVSIPPELPACQFGFESAWEMMTCPNPDDPANLPSYSRLLPTGAAALQTWQTFWSQGSKTFKWKIGVASLLEELKLFEQLVQALPEVAKLRLDANGSLNWEQACQWLEACDLAKIEFLEQPLPVDQFDAMLKLSERYATPIALDESVATLDQLETCHQQGWRGIFVIKAAIAGSPKRLRKFCQSHAIDVVWSSVFETAIARQFIETRLMTVPSSRAAGGTNHWFLDQTLDQSDFERLWQTL